MAAQTTADANLQNAIQVYYDRMLLTRLEKTLRLDQFGAKKKLPKNAGNEIKWHRFKNIAAQTTALTEGITPNAVSLESQQVTAVPVQYGAFVELSDLLEDESLDPMVENAIDVLSYLAALSLDTIIRNSLHGNLTDQFVNSRADADAITQSDVVNAEEIRKAVTGLKDKDVRPFSDGNFQAVVHPKVSFDIMSDTTANGWIEMNKYITAEKAMKGEVGKMYQCRVMESSNIEVAANTSTINVYRNFIFGMEAYGLVELSGQNLKTFRKQRGSSGTADPLDQRSTVGYKFSHVTKVLDADRAIEMYAASDYDA